MRSMYEVAGRFGIELSTLRRELEILAGTRAIRGDTTPVTDPHGQITPAAEAELADQLSLDVQDAAPDPKQPMDRAR
jgi:hypothetical protein